MGFSRDFLILEGIFELADLEPWRFLRDKD